MSIDMRAVGRTGLTGWRGKLASRVAQPISERTKFSRRDAEALIGWLFLALAILQFVKLVRTATRAGREASAAA
jgi:hypothetical protein